MREPGVFLNGFYEFRPITYGEPAYGFPRVGQSILNCPDGTIIKLLSMASLFVPTGKSCHFGAPWTSRREH